MKRIASSIQKNKLNDIYLLMERVSKWGFGRYTCMNVEKKEKGVEWVAWRLMGCWYLVVLICKASSLIASLWCFSLSLRKGKRSHRLQHCPFESNYFTIASKSDHCPHHTLGALMDSDMGNVTVTCEPNCPFFPLLSIIQLSIILSLPLSFSSFSPLWPSSFFFKCSTHFYLEGVVLLVHIYLIDIEIYKIINLRCG